MRTTIRLILLSILLLLSGVAFGAGPSSPFELGTSAPNFGRAGGASDGVIQVFSSTNAAAVVVDALTTDPVCWPVDTLVTIKAVNGALNCCWTWAPSDITFGGSASDANGFEVTYSTVTTRGACFDVGQNERVDNVPMYHSLERVAGARLSASGICDTPVVDAAGHVHAWAACVDDDDCSTAGVAGTANCAAADKRKLSTSGCAFLWCWPDTVNTVGKFRVER